MINDNPKLDVLFQALSDPIRRDIVQRLRSSNDLITVREIASFYPVSAPAISRHLKVLEEAGLLLRQHYGREHHLALNVRHLKPASLWLSRLSHNPHQDFLADLSS